MSAGLVSGEALISVANRHIHPWSPEATDSPRTHSRLPFAASVKFGVELTVFVGSTAWAEPSVYFSFGGRKSVTAGLPAYSSLANLTSSCQQIRSPGA